MACLSTAEKTVIKAEIERLTTLIELLYTTLANAIPSMGRLEYRFDSGDGSQKVITRSPAEIQKLIETLESSRSRLYRKLQGTLNVALNFSRRPGRYC